jgi:choice-of-anchor C domain-containing protein
MRTTLLASVAALLFFSADRGAGVPANPKKSKPANLLVNGSFEEGPDPEKFKPLDKGSTAIKGWTVTRGQIDYIGTFWQAADGKRSIDLHGSPGYGGVQQTFDTDKGKKYRVTFSLACTPGTGVKKVAVRAAGKKGEFRCDGSKATYENMGWKTHTWQFKAVADKTTLEIHTLETTDPERGPALDNVSVVAVEK